MKKQLTQMSEDRVALLEETRVKLSKLLQECDLTLPECNFLLDHLKNSIFNPKEFGLKQEPARRRDVM